MQATFEDDDVWISGNRSDGFCSFKLRGVRPDGSGEWVDGCFGGGVSDNAGFELITCGRWARVRSISEVFSVGGCESTSAGEARRECFVDGLKQSDGGGEGRPRSFGWAGGCEESGAFSNVDRTLFGTPVGASQLSGGDAPVVSQLPAAGELEPASVALRPELAGCRGRARTCSWSTSRGTPQSVPLEAASVRTGDGGACALGRGVRLTVLVTKEEEQRCAEGMEQLMSGWVVKERSSEA